MVDFSSKSSLSSDSALIREIQQGDKKALEYLYQKYWPMIAHFVRLNQGQPKEAEDLFQDGIIILYEKLLNKDFFLRYSLKTYLYAICRNQWLKKLRSKKNFKIIDLDDTLENIPELTVEDEEDLPDDKEMYQAIQNLKDPCYTLIIGYYYQKMSLEQLAKVLHYSSANVAKQRKFHCLERLKKAFRK